MPRLTELREQHSGLRILIGRLTRAVAEASPPPPTELYQLRHELTSALIKHLKAEDWVLYPELLASDDPVVASTARLFSSEMGGLAQAYSAYAERWGPYTIACDWEGYRRETTDILEALTERITREDRDLYPKAAMRASIAQPHRASTR